MKLTNLLCTGILSALVFTACVDNDDKSVWNDGSQPISFDASIQGMTRAVGNKWTAGDKVGVFMKVAGDDLGTSASLNGENKLYTTDANGILSAGNADNALYYPSDESKSVDFIAYYPYVTSLTNNMYKVNVADQTRPADIDLLYSDNATGFAKGTTGNPQLQFAHKLSQIVFNITKDATVPSLDGLTVTFKGLNTTADFALADGTLANSATPADIRALVNGTNASAIVLPAASQTDVKVIFSLNGKDFTADYPQSELVGGHKYVHKVTLSDQNGQPTITMDAATIEDWNEVAGGDINVDFGDGSDVPTPGEELVLIDETFGDPEKVGDYWPSIDIYTGWTDKSVSYSDPVMVTNGFSYSNASVRSTSTLNGHVWFAAGKESALKIEGFRGGCTNLKLTYQIAANAANAEQSDIKVITDKGEATVPGAVILTENKFQTVELTLPDGCTFVQFTSTAATNTEGYRIDNVRLVANASGEGGDVVDPTPDPDPEKPEPGKEAVIFFETCGDAQPLGSTRVKINDYTGWDNPNLTFNDRFAGEYQNGDVRATSITTNNVWLPAYTTTIEKPAALRISGFDVANYTNLKLSYSIAANSASNQNIIKVDCGGTMLTVPSVPITTANKYQTVELTVPDGISYIEFISDAANTVGFRIDSIKLVGTGK